MSKKPAQKEDFGQSKDGCKSHLSIQTGVLTSRRSFTFAPMVGSMDFRAGPHVPSLVGLTHRVKCGVSIRIRHFAAIDTGLRAEGTRLVPLKNRRVPEGDSSVI